eukprot:m.196269 g.196269  ORF g.196269 m.196269 type:complete len:483 (-) comp15697_c0_seq4:2740-4188(-)
MQRPQRQEAGLRSTLGKFLRVIGEQESAQGNRYHENELDAVWGRDPDTKRIRRLLKERGYVSLPDVFNIFSPCFFRLDESEAHIEWLLTTGYLGPLLLLSFAYGLTFGIISFGVGFIATFVVIVRDWGSHDCAVDENFTLISYFLLWIILGSFNLVLRFILQRWATSKYNSEMNIFNERILEIEQYQERIEEGNKRVLRGDSFTDSLSIAEMMAKKRKTNAEIIAGLRMILHHDEITSSWTNRLHMLFYVIETIVHLYVMTIISRLVFRSKSVSDACNEDSAEYSLGLLLFLGLWETILLPNRAFVILVALHRVLTLNSTVGKAVYNCGLRWAKYYDSLFLGIPFFSTIYEQLYSHDPCGRDARIRTKLNLIQQDAELLHHELQAESLRQEKANLEGRLEEIQEKIVLVNQSLEREREYRQRKVRKEPSEYYDASDGSDDDELLFGNSSDMLGAPVSGYDNVGGLQEQSESTPLQHYLRIVI